MEHLVIQPAAGAASVEAAFLLAMLDDQLALLESDTRDLSAEALAWQPGPGHNTMGMLLAHLAIVELFWVQIVLEEVDPGRFDSRPVLGIGDMDDGLPLPEGEAPPAGLAGRDITWFHDLLRRARAHVTPRILAVTPADLDRTITRKRANGELRTVSVRWMLYHVLEHFAAHYGQILLLCHLHRSRAGVNEVPA